MDIVLVYTDTVEPYVSDPRAKLKILSGELLKSTNASRKMITQVHPIDFWCCFDRDAWDPSVTDSMVWWSVCQLCLYQVPADRVLNIWVQAYQADLSG